VRKALQKSARPISLIGRFLKSEAIDDHVSLGCGESDQNYLEGIRTIFGNFPGHQIENNNTSRSTQYSQTDHLFVRYNKRRFGWVSAGIERLATNIRAYLI
jgi:hypothetical protein